MSYLDKKKIAIVHEWFDKYAGSERVVEQILNIYPDADVFALVDFLSENDRFFIRHKKVQTTFIQRLPFARKSFRNYLALFPLAIEQIDLRGYDIIISSSHAVAKGVLTNADQLHICYCHSPMRYAWDLYHQYLEESGLTGGLRSKIVKWILHYLRIWDQSSCGRVNYFIANSHFVARRIKNIYHREAHLIYPPADTENFVPAACKGDYYFSAARMVPYKKMDLIVAAFNKMPDKKLVITGAGKGLKKIQALAASNIVIKNRLTAAEFREYMIQAKGFVYAAEEDFGIVMAEAQAAGVPVIAYRKGGASEIVQDGVTGILFDYQTEASIIGAIQRFETISFDTNIIVARAQMFSVASFKENFSNYVSACCQDFFNLST